MGSAAERQSRSGLPAPAYQPIVDNRSAGERPGPLRVTLLNARGGGLLDGIAACLAQPPLNQSTIIMLCEADWRSIRARGREMPRELAARLGMSLVYLPQFACRPMHGSEGASTGNAVLSVTPFDEVQAVPVHNPKVGNRGYRRTLRAGRPAGIVARARHRGHLLTIGVAHLA